MAGADAADPMHLHLKQLVPAHISLPICKQRSCQGIRKSGGRHVLSQALGRQAQEEEEVKEEEKVEEEEVEKEEEEAKSLQFELSSSWHSCRKTSKARLTFSVFVKILWKCNVVTIPNRA